MFSPKALSLLCGMTLLMSFSSARLNAASLFQTTQSYSSGGQYTFGIAVGDVNGDGIPDLILASQCFTGVTCNYNQGNNGAVGVLLGKGDGTFQAPQTYYSGGGTSYAVAVADVNGDGKPDILAVNACEAFEQCSEGSVGVLLGNGDGTFQPAQSYLSGGFYPVSIAVADVNGDGKLDLLIGNQTAIGVLLGNGDGTFQAVQTVYGGVQPEGVAVADVNGDGKPDLLVANACITLDDCTGGVTVLLGNGDGTFQPGQAFSSGAYTATSILVVDINGDGKLDAVISNTCITSQNCSVGAVSTLSGNGDGTFQPAQVYASGGDGATAVVAADVNGDSKLDLIANNGCHSAKDGSNCSIGGVVGVLLGNGDGTFQAARPAYSGGYSARGLAVSDLNRDGRPDIVSANVFAKGSGNGTAGVLLNIGKFETTTTVASSPNPSTFGQAVNLTAKVTTIGSGTPTGKVAFKNGSTALGSATLSGGLATLTRTNLPAGSLSITATYTGDGDLGQSTSALVQQVVNQAVTTTTVDSSKNPSSQGQAVTFSAKVISSTVRVKGTVTFMAGATTLGSVALSGGKASYTTSALPVGSTNITATYNGTTNVAGSTASLTQVVN